MSVSLIDYAKNNKIKFQKSPLRYPGGKSKAIKQILSYIPSNIEKLYSPFFGGGSIELAVASCGIKVYGYDGFQPLVDFWKLLISDAVSLKTEITKYFPLNKNEFYKLREEKKQFQLERAAQFYVLNRCSFSGSTMSGGMSPNHPRFKKEHIEKLALFNNTNLQIRCRDFRESLQEAKDNFIYLDPPYYMATKLYGKNGDMHESFDHEKLAKELKKKKYWVMSYDDCSEIRKLYSEYKIITPQWKYSMSKNKSSNELLIINI